MTLVWGIRKQGNKDQRSRARWLFEQLEQERAMIILPSVVVAEYLCGVDPADRIKVAAELSELFYVPPFDIRCAKLAADLFMNHKDKRDKNAPHTRDHVKADALIIATASVAGAREFYSDDKQCLQMASSIMTAKKLPTQPAHLFGYPEDSK